MRHAVRNGRFLGGHYALTVVTLIFVALGRGGAAFHARRLDGAFCQLGEAVDALACADLAERGAVFTRREVVDFILDLAGYTVDKPLYRYRLLEPSFGNGDFLLPVIERLLASCKGNSGNIAIADLAPLSGRLAEPGFQDVNVSDLHSDNKPVL
jgi:hypothetical protein